MIVLSNSTAQTLTPGQSITFDQVKLHTGCGESHRQGSASVKLRCQGVYEVNFNGNIAATAATTEVQLTIMLGTDPLSETTMKSQTATANAVNNVAAGTFVKNCCGDYNRITVVNTGTADVLVDANTCLRIGRRSG